MTSKPVAKVHILIVAKESQLTSLRKVQEGKDEALLGHMMVQAASIAREAGLENGYRIVTDNGRDCQQKIHHLCLHVIGGQQLLWPPTKPLE